MTIYWMDRNLIEKGTWAQCKFCRRVAPTRAHTNRPDFNQAARNPAIEENGYCTDCQECLYSANPKSK